MHPLRDGSISLNGLTVQDFTDIVLTSMDPGVESVETSDIPNPVFDDVYMGVDMFRPPTWTFGIDVKGGTQAEMLANVGKVKQAWRNPDTAKRGGATTELHYQIAGRERLVYGRPRRFASNPTSRIWERGAAIDCDFQLSDPLHYEAGWRNEKLTIVPPEIRGLKEPLKEPLSTMSGAIRQGIIEDTDGDAPTPFLIDIHGPIVNPWVSINGHRYGLRMTLGENQWLRIDSREGVASEGGRSILSLMDDRIRLKGVRLPPNRQVEVSFGGIDPTGRANATYWWRPAYYSI